jgi:hypothetical protein
MDVYGQEIGTIFWCQETKWPSGTNDGSNFEGPEIQNALRSSTLPQDGDRPTDCHHSLHNDPEECSSQLHQTTHNEFFVAKRTALAHAQLLSSA